MKLSRHPPESPCLRLTMPGIPVRLFLALATFCILIVSNRGVSNAEWTVQGESDLFYTNDVALFSATRRLTRDQDPTQPVIDRELAEQGADGVFELAAQITKTFDLLGRHTALAVRGQGFLFFTETEYNHGTLGVQGIHELSASTHVGFRYYYGPDLFLGENEVATPGGLGEEELADEIVTTNFVSALVGHRLKEEMLLKIGGRFGTRRYNEEFDQRDTDFWTIGAHLEWDVAHRTHLAFGYHYERGLADGRNEPALQDDVSYYNHYLTTELDVLLRERLELEMAVHYEFNGWTSDIEGDERNGEHEDILQGDIAALYELTDTVELKVGFQGAYRKESFESGVENFNVWIGGTAEF